MRRCLPTALLMLTTACGLAAADDPPAQPVPETKSVATPPTVTYGGINAKKADVATTAKVADPGYTQVGGYIRVKLDRPKTQLTLYENSTYTIVAERDDVGILSASNPRLTKIEDLDGNSISFHTVKPGVTTLTFIDEEDDKEDGERYLVEITIVGDTRPLQAQLEKLYPQASIQAIKIGESVLLRGTVAKPEHVAEIVEIAEQFYPTVLNQLKVAGPPVTGPEPDQTRDTPVYGVPLPKPTGTPVYQSQPAQPRPTPIDPPVPHTIYNAPQSHPVRTPSPWPVSPPKTQIVIKALVLEIDWKQLSESKIDLARTIRAFASDPKPRELSDTPTKQSLFRATVVPTNTTDGIVRLLTATKAVKVISKPGIRTLAGQPAEMVLGQEIPTIAWGENGKPRVVIENHPIGTALKLTPWLVSKGGIKLAVVIEHSQRLGSTAAGVPGGFTVPNIRSYKLDLMVELNAGHSIILAETGPPAVKEKNQAVGKGLMVVLSPSLVAATPTVKRTPAKAEAANVVSVSNLNIRQAVRPAPQPVQPATFDSRLREPQDLHQSVRELRGEVRALRRDVGRLLKLLEKNEKKRNESRQSNISPADLDILEAVAKAAGVKQKTWKELPQPKMPPARQKILNALEKKVTWQFEKVPLAHVMRLLSQDCNINIVVDKLGLEEEGLTGKTAVTIHVEKITLKSALKLILEPLHLAYQIRDDVLVITSRQRAQGELVVATYSVADLVIPIPTFGPAPAKEIPPRKRKDAANPLSGRPAFVNLDTLMDTIVSTVQPDSWDELGGPGSIRSHKNAMSLVIRQTQSVHEEISDLLAQLRRLQDMQVALDVRFIDKLPDDIWKRTSVDFNLKKDANSSLGVGILTDQQAKLLMESAQGNEWANLIHGPKVTLFNGHTGRVNRFSAEGKVLPMTPLLHMQPVISSDRRNVRLNLWVSDQKSPEVNTRSYVNTVPDGKTLLIEIGGRNAAAVGVPVLDKTPFTDRLFNNTGVRRLAGHRFLLIRPRIVIQEEEEELLGLPPE